MNKWDMLKNFINSQYKDTLVTRQQIHKATNTGPRTGRYGTTVDHYRRILAICGVLEKTEKLGVYTIQKHIGENVSIRFLKEISYKETSQWKQWFMDGELFSPAPERKTK
jgi:diaminopimelate decarboxylase